MRLAWKPPVQIGENEFWLFEHAAERGVDPSRIPLSGGSAGGNMTCVMALEPRHEGGPGLAPRMPLLFVVDRSDRRLAETTMPHPRPFTPAMRRTSKGARLAFEG